MLVNALPPQESIRYLQDSVRQIHQLPLVLGYLGHRCCLVLLQVTDVPGDDLRRADTQ